jgi:hypothetical protein
MAKKRTVGKKSRQGKRRARRSRLLDFLVQIPESAELQAKLESDPESTMQSFGLSASERKALMSGDIEKIRRVMPGAKINLPPNTTIKITLIVIKF